MIAIVKNTILEFFRNKFLYIIIGFALLLIFLSFIVSGLSLSQQDRIIVNFNLSVIEFFGIITVLFMGSYLLYNEIVKGTILLILSKNPYRSNFIIGKFFGFSFIMFILYLVLSIGFFLSLFFHNIQIDIYYFLGIFLSYIKIELIIGFIIFFSTFVSPYLALLFSISIYIIGHMIVFAKFYMEYIQKLNYGDISLAFTNIIYYIIPNFVDLSLNEFLFSPGLGNYSIMHLSFLIISNIIYLSILLILSIKIFEYKEF